MHRPWDRNVLRVSEGQKEDKQAGVQGGGKRGEEEGWRGEQRPELEGQSWGLDFILLLCGERIVGK